MANSPQGWQRPRPRMRPLNPAAPGSMTRSMWPTAMRRAVALMCVGAVVAIVDGIVNGLTMNLDTYYSYSSASTSPHAATVHDARSLVTGIVEGIIIAGLWLWMAWKSGAGRNWARLVSNAFFGLLSLHLIGGIFSLARPGDTIVAFIVVIVEWGVGLAALVNLWRPESSEFFAFARRMSRVDRV